MDIQMILILLLVGIAAGVLSGLVGIGGGIIIVPALVFFLGFSQLQAQGTSLGILLLPVGILAVVQYYKGGHIDIKSVVIVALAFLAGGYLGSKIALNISEVAVKRIFALLLLLIGFKMFFFPGKSQEKQKTEVNNFEL